VTVAATVAVVEEVGVVTAFVNLGGENHAVHALRTAALAALAMQDKHAEDAAGEG